MLQTMQPRQTGTMLRVGVGVERGADALDALLAAAATARTDLDGAMPHLAVAVSTSPPRGDVVRALRGVLGPVGVTGGVTSGLLTDHGLLTEGALVLCVSNAEGATSGVAATTGKRLADAAQATGRLVLAGWPFRGRYPRGIAMAFAAHATGAPAAGFLTPWRELMGPKMRTVGGTMMGDVFGASTTPPLASVGCLEATYLMGLGLAEGNTDDADVMIHSSVDATRTALKWLESHPARLVLALESTARYRALGGAASREWAAIREQVREHDGTSGGKCIGWLCEEVAAYGRGLHPVDVPGALVIAALGDASAREDR